MITTTKQQHTQRKEKIMEKVYCKAGRVELTKEQAEKIYTEKRYICTSTAIWQPHFSQAQKEQQIYFTKIADYKGLARRGRFYALTAEEINHVMGFEYLRTE